MQYKYSYKNPSDLDADFEDNQDYDSAVSHGEVKEPEGYKVRFLEKLLEQERTERSSLKEMLDEKEKRIGQLEKEVRMLRTVSKIKV